MEGKDTQLQLVLEPLKFKPAKVITAAIRLLLVILLLVVAAEVLTLLGLVEVLVAEVLTQMLADLEPQAKETQAGLVLLAVFSEVEAVEALARLVGTVHLVAVVLEALV
jgi:hypothetical protein